MGKLTLDPAQMLKILKKDIDILEGNKSRLIRESDKLQGEVNDLSTQADNIKKTLKKKEDELIKKYQDKEAVLDGKIVEQNGLTAEVSEKRGTLDNLIALNKKLEKQANARQDSAIASIDQSTSTIAKLKVIVSYVEEELKKI